MNSKLITTTAASSRQQKRQQQFIQLILFLYIVVGWQRASCICLFLAQCQLIELPLAESMRFHYAHSASDQIHLRFFFSFSFESIGSYQQRSNTFFAYRRHRPIVNVTRWWWTTHIGCGNTQRHLFAVGIIQSQIHQITTLRETANHASQVIASEFIFNSKTICTEKRV